MTVEYYESDEDSRGETAEDELVTLLNRLRFNQSRFSLLLDGDKLLRETFTEQQKLFDERKQRFKFGDVAFRLISRRIWELCSPRTSAGQRNTAFEWLEDYLARRILPKVHDRELAQDLTQNALAIIVQKFATCETPETFLLWTAKIAVNEVLQERRRKASSNERLDDVNEPAATQAPYTRLASAPVDPETTALDNETVRQIADRIARMPIHTRRGKEYQIILYGTYFLGKTDEELAAILDIPKLEVQKRRSQALRNLREDKDWLSRLRPS
jgi:RNA polymerase sigma factor (sigma-70 family)